MNSRPQEIVQMLLVFRVHNVQTKMNLIVATHDCIKIFALSSPCHVLDKYINCFLSIELSYQIRCIRIPLVDITIPNLLGRGW